MRWEEGYLLAASVYDFGEGCETYWPSAIMEYDGIPATARHMGVVESYPMTYDAIMGRYE